MDAALIRALVIDEGLRLLVYDDATGLPIKPGSVVIGHPTIGIGRALDVHGLSAAEAYYLLDKDLVAIDAQLSGFAWWRVQSDVRKYVLASMAFNMGVNGLLAFHRMIDALTVANYGAAADEMLDSKWAKQLPARSKRLSDAMRRGAIQT